VFHTRRDFLARTGGGAGLLGLAAVLNDAGLLAADPARTPHHKPRAKAVIWVFPYGAPGSMDTFDHKPELARRAGQPLGETPDVLFGSPGPILASPFEFQQHGDSGAWVSELFPHTAGHVDKMAFLRAVRCDSNVHGPAVLQMNTGMTRVGYPSVGSWLTYGLGSAARDLPGFVVLYDKRSVPVTGPANWGSGFLPAEHQGVTLRPGPRPILDLNRQPGMTAERQRAQLDFLKDANAAHAAARPGEAELHARIETFELAYRMQSAAPQAVDIAGESPETRKLYGIDDEATAFVGTQLLLARRLVERGVRVVQVYHGGTTKNWDAHIDLKRNHGELARELDKPVAGLLADLAGRGLLDDTLVIWGAEFGRMPVSQDRDGRDHNTQAFTVWLAGGGVKPGVSHGASDELGYKPVAGAVHVNDLHATVLHLMGLNHERLTFRHNGRDHRLTDVAGRVIREVLR
jgi:hypothetical protein